MLSNMRFLSTFNIDSLSSSVMVESEVLRSATSCIAAIASPEISGPSSSSGSTTAPSLASSMSQTLVLACNIFCSFS